MSAVLDSDSDDDSFPEMGMGALSAETLALLVDFLPNRRFEDTGSADEGRFNEAQACVAYTAGDAMQIAATLKRLAQQHEEKEAAEREESKNIVRVPPPPPTELQPSTPGDDAFQTLTTDGVCRINGILPDELCDRVLADINRRLAAEMLACNPQERETGFGNVLCRESRWDMYLHNEGVYKEALAGMLGETTGPLSVLFHRLFDDEDGGVDGGADGDDLSPGRGAGLVGPGSGSGSGSTIDRVVRTDRYSDANECSAGTPHNVTDAAFSQFHEFSALVCDRGRC